MADSAQAPVQEHWSETNGKKYRRGSRLPKKTDTRPPVPAAETPEGALDVGGGRHDRDPRHRAFSAPGCHNVCGILSYVKDGKLVKVEGDPEDPYNQGRLCSRCLCIPDYVYHEDRLVKPDEARPRRPRQGQVRGMLVGRGLRHHRARVQARRGHLRRRQDRHVPGHGPRHPSGDTPERLRGLARTRACRTSPATRATCRASRRWPACWAAPASWTARSSCPSATTTRATRCPSTASCGATSPSTATPTASTATGSPTS